MKKIIIGLAIAGMAFNAACTTNTSVIPSPSATATAPPANSVFSVEVEIDRTKFSKAQDIRVVLRKVIVYDDTRDFENLEEITIAKESNDTKLAFKSTKLVSTDQYNITATGKSSDECNTTTAETKYFKTTDFINGYLKTNFETYYSTLMGCLPPGTTIPTPAPTQTPIPQRQ